MKTRLYAAYHIADAIHRLAWQSQLSASTIVDDTYPRSLNCVCAQVVNLPAATLPNELWEPVLVKMTQSMLESGDTDIQRDEIDLYKLVPSLVDEYPPLLSKSEVPYGMAAWPTFAKFWAGAKAWPHFDSHRYGLNSRDQVVRYTNHAEGDEELSSLLQTHLASWQSSRSDARLRGAPPLPPRRMVPKHIRVIGGWTKPRFSSPSNGWISAAVASTLSRENQVSGR